MPKLDEVDYMADFDNLYSKMDDFEKFFKSGEVCYSMLRYIPGLAKIGYQGQLYSTETERKYAHDTYKNKKVRQFNVQLTKGHYTNFQNVYLCFPLKFKLAADNNSNLVATTVTVNNLFAHWIKKIDIKRYGDDILILPRTNMVDIYRYSDELLKHMPKKALKTILKSFLCSKKPVVIWVCGYRRPQRTNDANTANRMDENLTDRIAKFADQLQNEFIYRISPNFQCDVDLVNQCFKFSTKYILTLETGMQKLFETNANQANSLLPISVDASVICTSVPYIQYEQFQLDDNFKTYLDGTLKSEHVLRTAIKPTSYQKSYELELGTQSRVIDFTEANKQFNFFPISLVDDNSDQHRTIYNSYNVERARKDIKSIMLENASNMYSTFNSVKFDNQDSHNQFLIYSQFVAWYCKGSSIAPLFFRNCLPKTNTL